MCLVLWRPFTGPLAPLAIRMMSRIIVGDGLVSVGDVQDGIPYEGDGAALRRVRVQLLLVSPHLALGSHEACAEGPERLRVIVPDD